jgi:hypothetical protein
MGGSKSIYFSHPSLVSRNTFTLRNDDWGREPGRGIFRQQEWGIREWQHHFMNSTMVQVLGFTPTCTCVLYVHLNNEMLSPLSHM